MKLGYKVKVLDAGGNVLPPKAPVLEIKKKEPVPTPAPADDKKGKKDKKKKKKPKGSKYEEITK